MDRETGVKEVLKRDHIKSKDLSFNDEYIKKSIEND
jgi:hypothetical protein